MKFQLVIKFTLSLFLFSIAVSSVAQDWPQWRGPDRNGTWTDTGLVDSFDGESLKPMWELKIGSGYSGPTVADGRVFVMDRLTKPEQVERVLCVDAESGKEIWKHSYRCVYTISYTAGPRTSVTVEGEHAYSMGAMGNLFCLNAKSGDVIWSHDLDDEYKLRATKRMPIWGQACSPIVYDNLVIVQTGAKEASVVGFNKKTGKEVWRSLDDPGQYSSPVLARQAGTDVLICWTGSSVSGLEPASGKVFWRHDFPVKNMPIGCASPVVSGNRVYLSSFYDGSLMLELSQKDTTVRQSWKKVGPSEKDTRALHSIVSTPVIIGDFIYGVDSYGELRCLRAGTGERVWEDLTAVPKARWSTIHFVNNDDKTWMFNERGELLIGKLSPDGFTEIDRTKIIEPTTEQLRQRGGVCWSHPAFAMKSVFARNDNQLIRTNLAK